MAGAGSYIAGFDRAAYEQVTPGQPGKSPENPPAYDPRTRAIPIGTNGVLSSAHWVDASMAYCLTNFRGTIPGNPEIGLRRERLRRATQLTAQSIVEDEVAGAIAHLLERRAVDLLLVAAVWRVGKLGFLVRYINRLAPASDVRTIEG